VRAVVGSRVGIKGNLPLRKPNYGFERRQRELDKQKKKEEKRLNKLARKQQQESTPEAPEGTEPPESTS